MDYISSKHRAHEAFVERCLYGSNQKFRCDEDVEREIARIKKEKKRVIKRGIEEISMYMDTLQKEHEEYSHEMEELRCQIKQAEEAFIREVGF